ncbi:MAG: hypothetical protein IPN96_20520 [Anaerolineales bacterium]|nr:hypothetical protein [Anaerolineales bacterium]
MGGTGNDRGNAIALDLNDNVYTTGYFQVNSDFDPGSDVFNLTSSGEKDTFVSKLDGNGNFNWAKKMGGNSDDSRLYLVLDSQVMFIQQALFNGPPILTPV